MTPIPDLPRVLATLLARAIDYAGLFPPAALDMETAARSYAEYRGSGDAWALGRFVIPAARLAELEREAGEMLGAPGGGPWRVSALVGDDLESEVSRIEAFNRRREGAAIVDCVEARAAAPWQITVAREAFPESELFVELATDEDPRPLLPAVRDAGAKAKVRTGGVTAAAFPPPAELARFIRACADLRVAFKATAGLHHPLRAEYRLTYDESSERGTMYGWLNVLLAAAIAGEGADEATIAALLDERSPRAIRVEEDAIVWREHRIDEAIAARTRSELARSFGSCSFREPLDELAPLIGRDGDR